MRKLCSVLLGIFFLVGVSFAETYNISSKVTSSNGGYVNIAGTINVFNCSSTGCDLSYNLNMNYSNFLISYQGTSITLTNSCTYRYTLDHFANHHRAQFVCSPGTLNLNGENYSLAVNMNYDNGAYSGTLTVNGQTLPIDNSLGQAVMGVYLLFTFLNY